MPSLDSKQKISKTWVLGIALLLIIAIAIAFALVSKNQASIPNQDDPKNWPACTSKQAKMNPDVYRCRAGL